MASPLYLIPLLPLAASLLLGLAGSRLPRVVVAIIGVGATAASFVLTAWAGSHFLSGSLQGQTQVLYRWLSLGELQPSIAFYLDPLSLVMCAVVTFVGALILLYSAQFMAEDDGYARFFCFMNLFVGSMLTLVLADNLLLLYLGWEGVGLCSYLLIGFWYRERKNVTAAFKAFLITRVGDTALLIGLLLIFTQLGTLQIQELMQRASLQWPVGSSLAVAAAALLLGGAVGKSAQLPLQTWLPDAMAGPTPVSALIHAATMVTAGVYLIARMHVVFELAPIVQWLVALVGAATLLLAACSALTQWDLKRVLAYSTMSQVGYMLLALGVGAWSAAIFHLFTHAFFKSLLFLSGGVVIQGLEEEHNILKMGGLRRDFPLAFWTFLIGAASLSAIPWVTAGFFSKDAILNAAYGSNVGFWLAGLIGALLTSVYAFRMVFLVFFGERRLEPRRRQGLVTAVPLVVLATLAVVAGYLNLPHGGTGAFTALLRGSFLSTTSATPGEGGAAASLQVLPIIATLAGIAIAALLYLRQPRWAENFGAAPAIRVLHRFWFVGWGFDWLYSRLFVRPWVYLARLNRADFVDAFYTGLATVTIALHRLLSLSQTGRVRSYALAAAVGALVLLAVVVLR
ncbi:MAG: NADH-quinone oxidoreductase subunit L [Armatimonadia bacterium]